MDESRIGGMYLAMLRRWLAKMHDKLWRKGLMRSGMLTGLILVVVVAGLGIAFREHMLGNFHKLKAKISTERQELPVVLPGGEEPIVLMRTRMMGDSMPEFLSATLLPGRGMNVLQITAYVPGKGDLDLMASPSTDEAAGAMSGTGDDADGQQSMAMGGAFEVPWADDLLGSPSSGGARVTTLWRGRAITLPAPAGGARAASGGLMLAAQSDSESTTALPDGGQAEATFDAEDFGAHWPSQTQVTVSVLMSSRTIDLTVVARNVGDVAEPIGIGWHPRFTISGGDRAQWRLRVPGDERVQVSNQEAGRPTGVLLPVANTPYDFTMRGGARLGTMGLDDCFVDLHQDVLDSGPEAELSDPADNYGMRLTALTSTIKAMRVIAPANADFVSIEPQYNYPDPFGREWPKDTDTGIVVLQPGQSTQWKVRLELFSLANTAPQM